MGRFFRGLNGSRFLKRGCPWIERHSLRKPALELSRGYQKYLCSTASIQKEHRSMKWCAVNVIPVLHFFRFFSSVSLQNQTFCNLLLSFQSLLSWSCGWSKLLGSHNMLDDVRCFVASNSPKPESVAELRSLEFRSIWIPYLNVHGTQL